MNGRSWPASWLKSSRWIGLSRGWPCQPSTIPAQAIRGEITGPVAHIVLIRLHRRRDPCANSDLPLTLHDYAA
jgi:hypothetical protein